MVSWLVAAKESKVIDEFSYSEFSNVKSHGEGRFSRVKTADWHIANRKVALKRLKAYDDEKFEAEVQLHCLAHASKNVIRFLGLTKEKPNSEKFLMVMEYADQNNLRAFLRRGKDISWETKYKLSLDIAKGLEYLFQRDVTHSDLHSNNIVISQLHLCKQPEYIAKITDFGGAMKNDGNDISKIIGQIPFTDPEFLNVPHKYKRDHKSDVYSMGVIFWEVSTERIPFEKNYMSESRGDFRDLCLTLAIISGKREVDEETTPDNYKELYKECWVSDPSQRPMAAEVIKTLKSIISGSPQQTITEGQ